MMKVTKLIKQVFPAKDVVEAHCDGPCGVYDPASARIAAGHGSFRRHSGNHPDGSRPQELRPPPPETPSAHRAGPPGLSKARG